MESMHQDDAAKGQCKNDSKNQDSETSSLSEKTTQLPKIPTFGKAIFLLCGIVNFGISFGFPTSLSVYFLDWQDSFEGTRANTATIHATCIGTLNTGAILPGLLMSRFGDRITLLVGCFLASLGMIISMFANGVTYMVFSTGILFGMGCCMINLPTIPCITSVFTKNQSIYIASLSFGAGLLNTVLPYFYRFLAGEYGWRGSYLVLSGLVLQTCVSSLIITSLSSSSRSTERNNSCTENLLENEDNNVEKTQFSDENKSKQLSTVNFLLEGISLTSLHSSTFGSQMLGGRLKKTTDKHFLGSRESVPPVKENGSVLLSSLAGFDSEEVSVTPMKKSFISKLRKSHPFLFDTVYLVEIVTSSVCLSAVYSTIALMMDFTKFKGYDDESISVFFVFVAFLCSMMGKIFTGLMNLIPAVHSIYLLCSYSLMTCVSLIVLNYISSYYALCVVFAVMGFTLGGMASVYPKCVLDMTTVEVETYPIALGINNTLLGIFDVTLPVLMGYTVDRYLSYTPVLFIYSLLSLVLSTTLMIFFGLRHVRTGSCRTSRR